MTAAQRLEEYVVEFHHKSEPFDSASMLEGEAAFDSVACSTVKRSSGNLARRRR